MKVKSIKAVGIEPTWDIEVEDVHEFCLDNGCVSHNTSSLALSFTEGCEPIRALKINKEGTYTLPFLAPNLVKNRPYYEMCWDIENTKLLDLAAIRQKFIDQSQSTNLYFKKMDSATGLLKLIEYAENLGIKTLYYLNSMKSGDSEEECASCSV
jgi:ribonucleoside-diphosphate reductase alpha chain